MISQDLRTYLWELLEMAFGIVCMGTDNSNTFISGVFEPFASPKHHLVRLL